MERVEYLNLVLKPLDLTIDFELKILKKLGIYRPLADSFYAAVKKLLYYQFSILHKLAVTGEENIPDETGAILASNHQSWLDAQVIACGIRKKLYFISKSELFSWPLLRHILDITESLSIIRGGDDKGLEDIIQALKQNKKIVIFPEGTIPGEEDIPRSAVEKETGLLQGKTGMVRLALLAKVPVIPVGISGTGRAFPPEAFPRLEQLPIIKNEPVMLKIGKPIYFKEHYKKKMGKGIDKELLRELTDNVMHEISVLVDHSRDYIPRPKCSD